MYLLRQACLVCLFGLVAVSAQSTTFYANVVNGFTTYRSDVFDCGGFKITAAGWVSEVYIYVAAQPEMAVTVYLDSILCHSVDYNCNDPFLITLPNTGTPLRWTKVQLPYPVPVGVGDVVTITHQYTSPYESAVIYPNQPYCAANMTVTNMDAVRYSNGQGVLPSSLANATGTAWAGPTFKPQQDVYLLSTGFTAASWPGDGAPGLTAIQASALIDGATAQSIQVWPDSRADLHAQAVGLPAGDKGRQMAPAGTSVSLQHQSVTPGVPYISEVVEVSARSEPVVDYFMVPANWTTDTYGTSTAYSGANGTVQRASSFSVFPQLQVSRPGLLYGIELQTEAVPPPPGVNKAVPLPLCTANITITDDIGGFYTILTWTAVTFSYTGQAPSQWRYLALPTPISVLHEYYLGVILTCEGGKAFQSMVYNGSPGFRADLYTAASVPLTGVN